MKDPAFLFYSNDFLSGTMLMTDEQIGKYIKLLCLQHQKGHLKEKDMLNICKTYDEDIFSKFIQDEEGLYYNERLEEETKKRNKYCESRKNNRKKKDLEEPTKKTYDNTYDKTYDNTYDNTYVFHMENENDNENIISNNSNNINSNNSILYDKNVEKINDLFIETIGSTNINNIRECIEYLNYMDVDTIEYALKKTARAGAKWNFTIAILENYKDNNIKTLKEAQAQDLQYKNNKKPAQETDEERLAREIKEMEARFKDAD
jgi:hypothetical protein